MRGTSSALRRRLTVASFLLSLLLVSAAVGALLLLLRHQTAETVAARLQERGAALAATVSDRDGRVDVVGSDESLFDGPNWVFTPRGVRIEGPVADGALGEAVAALSRATAVTDRTAGPWHLRAVPVRDQGHVAAVAVTGVDEAPYLASSTLTVGAAMLLGLFAVAGATGLAALVLSRSLGPIAGMTAQAARWSRADSDGRFDLGPPRDEITSLASVLDGLLDRVDAALQAERRLTAEIAHELRTPLTLLIGEAQLALMNAATPASERARYERIEQAATSMARAITTLLEAATVSASGASLSNPADLGPALRAAVSGAIQVRFLGDPVHVAVSPAVLERILAPLAANAVASGASTLTVRTVRDGELVRLEVQDDGSGIPDAVGASLFDAGVSTRTGGTGLGLPLARRLAEDAGGELTLQAPRPATFALRLPAAATSRSVQAPVKVR